jgi:hypothetical protein
VLLPIGDCLPTGSLTYAMLDPLGLQLALRNFENLGAQNLGSL